MPKALRTGMTEQEALLGIVCGDLYRSSRNLIERFEVEEDPDTAWLKFEEEVKELREVIEVDGVEAYYDTDALAEEAVDVMVTLINLLGAEGIEIADLSAAMVRVIEKNDAKNHDTHVLFDGLITRRSKLENNGNG